MEKSELIGRLMAASIDMDVCCDCLCGDPEIEHAYCLSEKAHDIIENVIKELLREDEDDE